MTNLSKDIYALINYKQRSPEIYAKRIAVELTFFYRISKT